MADQERKPKGTVDIVFLIDVTGSMQTCIEGLKRNIEVFIDTLTAKGANNSNPVKDWRAKVAGYRDFEDNEAPAFVDAPFVREPELLKGQLRVLTADGGGDGPESLLDALYKVATMPATAKGTQEEADKWRYHSAAGRVVIIFTDAGYKPAMVIPEASGGTVDDVIHACNQNRIILNIFAPDTPQYDDLAKVQKAELNAIDGPDYQRGLEQFTEDQANFRTAMEQLARTVSASAVVEKV